MERITLSNQDLRQSLHELHIALIGSTIPLIKYRDIPIYNEIRKAANRLHQLVSREHNLYFEELTTTENNEN